MIFEVTILGCGAATPTSRFSPSAQVVNVHDKLFLVDCGEGTQMQIRKNRIKMQRIRHIFISHLHGDHYLGLLGLLSSLHLLGRTAELHLYGPPELKELVEINLRVSQTWLVYPLHIHPLSFDGLNKLEEDRTLEIYSFPLSHRIPCCGFLFREKERPLRLKPEAVHAYKLSPDEMVALKGSRPVSRADGQVILPEVACEPSAPPRSYAYCSDTRFWEPLAQWIRGVDLLYHESTFLESEFSRAGETYHSTAQQAAEMAKMAGAGQLMLGHFSSRYDDLRRFVDEASPVFPEVILAEEGRSFPVGARVSC